MAHQNKAKHVKRMSVKAIARRVKKMVDLRTEVIKNGVEKVHVRIQPGNSKTGKSVWTVSGIPIADCPAKCARIDEVDEKGCVPLGKGGCGFTGCYDIQNVCFQTTVQKDRARNSAIHMKDRERFWKEVEEQVVENKVEELRINVGGDLDYLDMLYINDMAQRQKGTDILFFTKDDDSLNKFLDTYGDFEGNVHYLLSAWIGMELKNPHNVPESHLIWEDGSTSLPEYAEHVSYCGGNCTECHKANAGCWKMRKVDNPEEKQYQILFAH